MKMFLCRIIILTAVIVVGLFGNSSFASRLDRYTDMLVNNHYNVRVKSENIYEDYQLMVSDMDSENMLIRDGENCYSETIMKYDPNAVTCYLNKNGELYEFRKVLKNNVYKIYGMIEPRAYDSVDRTVMSIDKNCGEILKIIKEAREGIKNNTLILVNEGVNSNGQNYEDYRIDMTYSYVYDNQPITRTATTQVVRFLFDGDKLVEADIAYMGVNRKQKNTFDTFTDEIPADVFELPEGVKIRKLSKMEKEMLALAAKRNEGLNNM